MGAAEEDWWSTDAELLADYAFLTSDAIATLLAERRAVWGTQCLPRPTIFSIRVDRRDTGGAGWVADDALTLDLPLEGTPDIADDPVVTVVPADEPCCVRLAYRMSRLRRLPWPPHDPASGLMFGTDDQRILRDYAELAPVRVASVGADGQQRPSARRCLK